MVREMLGTPALDVFIMLPGRRNLSNKLEPCHPRWYGRKSFEIRRSMGGSVSTSFRFKG